MATNVLTGKTKIRGGGDALRAIGTSFASRFGAGKKSRAALALAVSLWIANGGVASAEVWIDVENSDTVTYNGLGTGSGDVEPGIGTTGVKTLTASGDWGLNELWGANGSIAGTISGYKIIVAPNAKLNGVRGGWNNGAGDAIGNTVIIGAGATISGEGVSGGTVDSNSANATGNTVELQGATINGHVRGGRGNSSGSGDLVMGNTLILSGANTVSGLVQNFETIKLSDALEWNDGQTVLNATSSSSDNFTNKDGSKMTLDISEATNLKSATSGKMTLLSSGKDNAFDGFKLKDFDSNVTTLSTVGTKVLGGETTSAKNGVTLVYDSTHTVKLEESNKKVTYNVINSPVKTITLGEMTWGTPRTIAAGDGYTFDGNTKIDAENLSFTGKATTALAVNGSVALLAGATGLTENNEVTNGTAKHVGIDYTDKGIKFDATATGDVKAATGAVNYEVIGVVVDSVNLSNWNGETSAVPTGWTMSSVGVVETGSFTAPTIAAGTSKDILTTSTDNFFRDQKITGALIYAAQASSSDEAKGVTLTGSESKGVKASADGKNLVYERSPFNVSNIALGEMKWNEGRTLTSGYNFANTTTIDATNLKFTNPDAVTGNMTLLSGATNLAAGDNIAHTQNFTTDAANGVKLSATLSGNVTRAAGQIGYTATATTLNKIDLSDWNGKTSAAVPTGWTSNLGDSSITGANLAPDVAAGTSKDILTATTGDFFNESQIADSIKYKSLASSSDTVKGVTLTGSESKGVKISDGGKNLVYERSPFNVSKIALGSMEWGTARDASAAGYNYASVTDETIDASKLTFTNPNAVTGTTTLLQANATLVAGDNIAHTQNFTTTVTNRVKLSATLSGNVTRTTAGQIGYTATGTTLNKIDLSNWDGKTSAAVPTGWTSSLGNNSITAEGFTAPYVASGTTNILTTTTDGFFSDSQIADSIKSKLLASSSDTYQGVTLTGAERKGVKISNGGKNLVYERSGFNVSKIAFGEMTWNEGRTLTSGYNFMNTTTIDATNLKFTNPEAATGNMTLLSGATNLAADKTVTGASHTQDFTVNANGATLSATLSGNVTRAAGQIGYTATGTTLNKIDLSDWNGTTYAVPTGWTPNLGNSSITGANLAPDVAAGTSKDILTTTTGDFFNESQIADSIKYKSLASSSDTVKGVTLTGSESKGVKISDGGKNLVYERNDFNVSKIALGSMEWGTPRDASAAGYKYDGVTDANIDASKLTFTNPDAVTGTTTLLNANATLTAMAGDVTKDVSYSYNPVDGVTVSGIINGTLSKSVTDIQYTATANNATKLTFGNVEWKETDALMTRPTNITFAGANVDTSNINFKNIQSLEANKQMTLVANFDGNGSETFTGTKYKVGSTLQGQGKASLDGNDLIFTAETAVAPSPAPTPSPTPSSDDSGNSNSSSNSNSGNSNNNYYYNTNTNNNNNTNNNTNNNSNSNSGGELVLEVQEQTHNTVMGAMAGMAALSAGNDFIGAATDGLALASNIGADGISSYANMGGGNMRQETGSHVDTHTWNAIIALGHKNEKERGSLEYGAFFEYGTGNYTTFNGDERGDGSSHYTGGGVLAKWTANHGLYVEGSLRAGRVHDDARNVLRDASGMPYSYTTNANYFGFHVGVGKEIALDDIHTLDVYGKFFYNRRNGVSFDAGGHYDLDAVTSKIVRVGARYTIKSEKWDIYAGAAYEHELDGKAAGKADGLSIRGADTSGGSFRGELGATVTPDKNVPVKLDFNLTGFAGKKRGFSGGVSVALMF